jgi:Leucine-rich repeat (LRR) protein
LEDNQLNGTIPSSLEALTALPLLSLSCNQLSRTIPSSLTDLMALEFLYLEDNQLSGTVPFCNGAERTQSHNVFVGGL